MKNAENLSEVIEKLNDLKSVFGYSQKVIPIIQSLLDFTRETVPLLENINSSISDSTSKIPKAAHQINDVTNATELATTEILDKVDTITLELNVVNRKMVDLMQAEVKREEIFQKIKNSFDPDSQPNPLFDEYEKLSTGLETIPSLIDVLKRINEETNNITLSLQVQDITSQQLASVNHLIYAVQKNLSSLIKDFENTDMPETSQIEIGISDENAFDARASYLDSAGKQNFVDSVVSEQKKNASQDEIDKLFS